MYALIDGKNFYVSCERVFRRDLCDRPVVVLSNNDGCAIARGNEAKALGIKMGEPLIEHHHLQEALTEFASRAAEKLRKQDGHAS